MLDPEKAAAWMEHHFDTVTDEQFIENVRRRNPELAQEMWGDMPTSEILSRRDALARAHASAVSPPPRIMSTPAPTPKPRGIAGVFASFRHSVLKLFS